MGKGFSILVAMKETPDSGPDVDLRARALLALFPAQVHGLRNALFVVQGTLELVLSDAAYAPTRARLADVGKTLERLVALARTPSTSPRVVVVGDLFRDLEILLRPLEQCGVQLGLEEPGVASLRVDERFEALLLVLCVGLLADRPGPRCRLRLFARTTSGGLCLVLHAVGCRPALGEREALRAHARERAWPVSIRSAEGRLSMIIGLPVEHAPEPVAKAPTPPRRVMLLHRLGEERELASAVLRESGFFVHACSVEPETGHFALALVERRLMAVDSTLAARLIRRFALEHVVALDDRLRPEELLALVKSRD